MIRWKNLNVISFKETCPIVIQEENLNFFFKKKRKKEKKKKERKKNSLEQSKIWNFELAGNRILRENYSGNKQYPKN